MLPAAVGRAVGLLALLYLSPGCCCHYIRYRDGESLDSGTASPSQKTFRICGSTLTSFITVLCNGYLKSPNGDSSGNANASRSHELESAGVVEQCCKRKCNVDFLMKHCGESRAPTETDKDRRNIGGDGDADEGTNDLLDHAKDGGGYAAGNGSRWSKVKSVPERNTIDADKVRESGGKTKKRGRKRKGNEKGRKKRKPPFKWECAYKSFGHYLLKLDRDVKMRRNGIRKGKQRVVPEPIQAGTISPQWFGGDPVVVPPRRKPVRFHRSD